MGWGATAILIIFGAFVVLMIVNPNMSCFGRRLKSPLYPLTRKRQMKKKMTDYRFHPADGTPAKPEASKDGKPPKKTDDYGFRLD